MAQAAIGTGCDEASALICLGHKAPRWTKLGPGSEDEDRARQREKAPCQRQRQRHGRFRAVRENQERREEQAEG